jgi:hypothetical protein
MVKRFAIKKGETVKIFATEKVQVVKNFAIEKQKCPNFNQL